MPHDHGNYRHTHRLGELSHTHYDADRPAKARRRSKRELPQGLTLTIAK